MCSNLCLPFSAAGDAGASIDIKCNNYRMDFVVPHIHMYDVTYKPDLPTDARRQRRRVVLDQCVVLHYKGVCLENVCWVSFNL